MLTRFTKFKFPAIVIFFSFFLQFSLAQYEGDCCEPNGSPGCEDQQISECVCAIDSICCFFPWTSYCVTLLELFECGNCPDPCYTNNDCGAEDYCQNPARNCAGEGVCTPRPADCFQIWDPVCGCNGSTYTNSCYAAMAGVSVDYPGECGTEACNENNDCDPNQYCAFGWGSCSSPGTCMDQPVNCPDVWEPVCGCDEQTYTNECYAAMAGVNVLYTGECISPSCYSNNDCSIGEYCQLADGDCNGSGTCTAMPIDCFQLWDPVCGCDGNTYSNDCFAAMAGTNVDYSGECHDSCTLNLECSVGEYCAKDDGNCDGEGLCQPQPELCPDVWDPVCGCDGSTYANNCYAAMAGVNVDYAGACIIDNTCIANADCPDSNFCDKEDGDCDSMGVCNPMPVNCPMIWDPVCGCDGNTYSNDCFAAMTGTNVDYAGECVINCYETSDCDPDEYCAKTAGDCEAEGLCELRPEACPEVWAPVCGCDGNTYTNNCYAAMAGTSVDYGGECTGPAECMINLECNDNSYCAKPDGDCNGQGLCELRPIVCFDIWDPVCGCNGNTYTNTCYAAAAGINVSYNGECEAICSSNLDCSDNDFCIKPAGACDDTGVCGARPEFCPDVWDPVCGCDGNTYTNNCYAALVGVNVDYEGECTTQSCITNLDCNGGEYCHRSVCSMYEGICVPQPEVCPDIWDPVCGCDGVTYGNACEAAAAGVNVDYVGGCISPLFCDDNDDCAPEDYCVLNIGSCGGNGICVPRPETCFDIWLPVCGCDGQTYSNSCYAAHDGVNLAYDGICTGVPVITAISDIPDDQGGWVLVQFLASSYDTDGFSRSELYTVERHDGGSWTSVGSSAAYDMDEYTVQVPTLSDATPEDDALTEFRVIAAMDEGTWASESDWGFSIDNLTPEIPTDLRGEYFGNLVHLEWDPVSDEDLQYYRIYLNGSFLYYSANHQYQDNSTDYGEIATYMVAAVDTHANESGMSNPVEVAVGLPGDLNGDGSRNVADIVDLVGIILDQIQGSDYQWLIGDLDESQGLNVTDIVLLVDIILTQ